MSVDLYIYNATQQNLEIANSIAEVALHTFKAIPAGAQGKITVADTPVLNAVVARVETYGVVNHSGIASPTTFTGVSHNSAPVLIGGKAPKLV